MTNEHLLALEHVYYHTGNVTKSSIQNVIHLCEYENCEVLLEHETEAREYNIKLIKTLKELKEKTTK